MRVYALRTNVPTPAVRDRWVGNPFGLPVSGVRRARPYWRHESSIRSTSPPSAVEPLHAPLQLSSPRARQVFRNGLSCLTTAHPSGCDRARAPSPTRRSRRFPAAACGRGDDLIDHPALRHRDVVLRHLQVPATPGTPPPSVGAAPIPLMPILYDINNRAMTLYPTPMMPDSRVDR